MLGTSNSRTSCSGTIRQTCQFSTINVDVQGLTDLITETEDGVSPMTYIRSLYPRDWDHFLERMGARLSGIEPSAVRSTLSHTANSVW